MMPELTKENVNSYLHPKLLQNSSWKGLRDELWVEIQEDYELSWQKAVVDYILMDSTEMDRLRIKSIPHSFRKRVIRAPVPWHDNFSLCRETQTQQLFITNKIMSELQLLWWNK